MNFPRYQGSKDRGVEWLGNRLRVVRRLRYAVVTTLSMPGVSEVYVQVSAKLAIKPKVPVPA